MTRVGDRTSGDYFEIINKGTAGYSHPTINFYIQNGGVIKEVMYSLLQTHATLYDNESIKRLHNIDQILANVNWLLSQGKKIYTATELFKYFLDEGQNQNASIDPSAPVSFFSRVKELSPNYAAAVNQDGKMDEKLADHCVFASSRIQDEDNDVTGEVVFLGKILNIGSYSTSSSVMAVLVIPIGKFESVTHMGTGDGTASDTRLVVRAGMYLAHVKKLSDLASAPSNSFMPFIPLVKTSL